MVGCARLLSITLGVLFVVGCGEFESDHARKATQVHQVRAYTIHPPSYEAEAILHELNATLEGDNADLVSEIAHRICSENLPSNTAWLALQCETWARENPDAASRVADRLLQQHSNAAQWAGLRIADCAGLSTLVSRKLPSAVES